MNFSALREKFRYGRGLIRIARNWPELLLWNFGVLKGQFRVAHLRSGLRFKLRWRNADLSMLSEVIGLGIYDQVLPPGNEVEGVIIDIGAHLGFFSLEMGRRFPSAKVYAFEPFPENYALLRENLGLNEVSNVTAHNLAVAGKTGSISFFPVEEHSGCHSMYDREGAGAPIKVEATTLATIFKRERIRRCSFLKMDCEGAEFPILLSSSDATLHKVDRIAMEFHEYLAKKPVESLVKRLRNAGFSVRLDRKYSFLYARRK